MSDGNRSLLLDTHYWIWMQTGDQGYFRPAVAKAIESGAAAGRLLISIISVWEFAMLESKGRIRIGIPCAEWVSRALDTPGLSVAPLTPEIAIESTRLPGFFHGDPADRIIAATARHMNAQILTRDERLIAYGKQHHVAILS